ncbi:phosphopantetheine-binding protein [Streptomyces sp. NPDC050095]|uniref:phosphopantetheine-binding protein n=1 Tax=unclassified Streptomyces TaxID=2593676 RepID=UPI003441FE66
MSLFDLVPRQEATALAPAHSPADQRHTGLAFPLAHTTLPAEPHPGAQPGTPVQEIVRDLFAEALGLPRGAVDADSDFFRLGGSTDAAAQLLVRIRQLFATGPGPDPGPDPGLGPGLDDVRAAPTPARLAALLGDPVPTATGPRLRPGHGTVLPLRLQGPLDETALDHALADLGQRHEALRNSRLGNVGTRLCTLGPDDRLLELALPADVVDPWSVWPLASELARAYQARVTGNLPHRSPCTPETAPRVLDGDQEPTALPGSTPHERHDERRVLAYELPASAHRQLAHCASEHHVSLFMLVHAALAQLVADRGAAGPVTVAAPVPARHDAALRDAVAPHSRILALTVDTAGQPGFAELLSRTKAAHLEAYRRPDAPLAAPGGLALTILQDVTGTLHAGGLAITPQQPVHAAQCAALSLTLTERHDAAGQLAGLGLIASYHRGAVAQKSADALCEDLLAALAALSAPSAPSAEPSPGTTTAQAWSGVRSS